MKLVYFKLNDKSSVAIVKDKITGVTPVRKEYQLSLGSCFISTGADSEDGENGFYVFEKFADVCEALEEL